MPNACNQCHTDKSVDWAVQASRKWWGEAELDELGPALAAAWRADATAVPMLAEIAGDASRNSIVRASALQALGLFPEEAV